MEEGQRVLKKRAERRGTRVCEDKIRGLHGKGTQYTEADTPLDIYFCSLTGPQTTIKRPRGWGTSTQVSGMFFLLRDSV